MLSSGRHSTGSDHGPDCSDDRPHTARRHAPPSQAAKTLRPYGCLGDPRFLHTRPCRRQRCRRGAHGTLRIRRGGTPVRRGGGQRTRMARRTRQSRHRDAQPAAGGRRTTGARHPGRGAGRGPRPRTRALHHRHPAPVSWRRRTRGGRVPPGRAPGPPRRLRGVLSRPILPPAKQLRRSRGVVRYKHPTRSLPAQRLLGGFASTAAPGPQRGGRAPVRGLPAAGVEPVIPARRVQLQGDGTEGRSRRRDKCRNTGRRTPGRRVVRPARGAGPGSCQHDHLCRREHRRIARSGADRGRHPNGASRRRPQLSAGSVATVRQGRCRDGDPLGRPRQRWPRRRGSVHDRRPASLASASGERMASNTRAGFRALCGGGAHRRRPRRRPRHRRDGAGRHRAIQQ